MAEEQTTEESVVDEGQPVEEPQVDEGQPSESSEAETDSSVGESVEETKEDWWDTSGLDEKAAKRVKSIQTEYNKKAEENKEAIQKAAQAEQNYNYFVNNVRTALMSPDYMNQINMARQQLLGTTATQGTTNEMPTPEKMDTQEDLLKYLTGPYAQWLEHRAETKAMSKIQPITQRFYHDKWIQADKAMQGSDVAPVYSKYSQKVLEAATALYDSLSKRGMDEKQILETALYSIPEARTELIRLEKQQTLRSVEKKRRAVTEKPKRKMSVTSAPKDNATYEEKKAESLAALKEAGFSFES